MYWGLLWKLSQVFPFPPFTRAIPTAQCMNCHMHQPNIFLNSFLGYTMWDYESDAPAMWPEKQRYPSSAEQRKILDRNPEGASVRGKWSDWQSDPAPKPQATRTVDTKAQTGEIPAK